MSDQNYPSRSCPRCGLLMKAKKSDKGYWKYRCMPCDIIRSRKYRAKNPYKKTYLNNSTQTNDILNAQRRNYNLIQKYGITAKEYNELLSKQNGLCAICKTSSIITRLDKLLPLAVDHDHKINKVRGLLCTNCNVGLAQFKDNINLLYEAIGYLLTNKDKYIIENLIKFSQQEKVG